METGDQEPEARRYTPEGLSWEDSRSIKEVLEAHRAWLEGRPEGVRAVFRGVTLNDVNLEQANLTRAILKSATLLDAKLSGADLTGAELEGVDLRRLPFQAWTSQGRF
jgi:uncharacterized protein YjbI with pentapeptide repeats